MTARKKNIALLVFSCATMAQLFFAYVAFAQTVAPESAISPTTSRNWAGYVADSGSYTSVSGSWTVSTPTVTVDGSDAAWVGIGGVHSRDLLQVGTQAFVQNGSIQYSAWYEALPGLEIRIPLTISGGDKVSASVAEISPNIWHLHLRNETSGQTFDKDVFYESSRSSVEWIQEKPTGVGFSVALDDFGTLPFSGGATTVDGATVSIAGAGAHALQMANRNNELMATVSALGADGASFSVTRTAAPSNPMPLHRRGVNGNLADFYTRSVLQDYTVYVLQDVNGLHVYLAR